MATNASSVLRMSGMSSGLDTEAIVNALTANTKLKITKNERKVLKLQAQQEAYRAVSTKMTDFQNKYFDILNANTYLKGKNIYNQYKSSMIATASGKAPVGVTASSSPNATEGTNTITLLAKASQAVRAGSSFSDNAASLDIASYTNTGETYTIDVTVGSTSKTIDFASGVDNAATINNINDALKDAFGQKNNGDGLVSLDASNKIVSADKAGVTTSAISQYESSATLNLTAMNSGTNTLSFVHDGEKKTVSFITKASDYFDDITAGTASSELQAEYDSLATDYYNSQALYGYMDWSESASAQDRENLYNDAWAIQQTTEEFADAYSEALTASGMSEEDFLASEDYQNFMTAQESEFQHDYSESLAYKDIIFPTTPIGQTDEETFLAGVTPTDIINHYNRSYITNTVGALSFSDGTRLSVDWSSTDSPVITAEANGTAQTFSATAASSSENTFGLNQQVSNVTTVSTSTKLSELGATANAEGKYVIDINGTTLSFEGDTTVKQMISAVNSSTAGVKLSFSTVTNSFNLTANDYGTSAEINIADSDGTDLLARMGFSANSGFTQGQNLRLEVDGLEIETASNSYEVNGTNYTFGSAAVIGETFTNEVTKDFSQAIEAIKSFVTDYNTMITDVYKYLDEEPNDDYYFLTDDDKDEMELSDKQEEKWDTVAKQGLLYNDSTISGIMSKMRTALYSSTTLADGSKMALYNIGITASSDYTKHGTLILDEKALTEAFENNAEAITDLFTNTTTGIMSQLDSVLDSAVKTTGAREDKGVLIQKAGLANTSSSTDNTLYDEIKSIKTLIDSLNERYEQQQDRYWSTYSSLESQMSKLNSQTSYITSMLSSS